MRDYNSEHQDNSERQYAYDFDYVLRRYMMRTFAPLLPRGKALELGCFEGETTKLYAEHFNDLTVVEAADSLIAVARTKVPPSVKFIHATIESAVLQPIYDAIFLVHTLEHLDDRVAGLARMRQWLSPAGRLFVVVPNANAASRQIAVKMGLIATNSSVTEGEAAHGHRCTYSLDTLENDVRQAGLKVESRGGIFFKPFANFQFDRMLEHGIIDEGYLEGCYALGMQHADLTASIYMVCSRGDRAAPPQVNA
ncbi:MAG TPA: class I SAM-dependent methyltransferase [Steroidobacteraceae bacterium]|nr:class I SAM-dependent methyltransferase [Steroidobacteraceae bacterium]